jgi:glucose/arabinose dehydrogenase
MTLASGLDLPTAMARAPDGRIFIAEKSGDLRVVKDGVLLAQPFLSLPVDSAGERGLLGVTFDPNFAANRFVYVYYTTSSAPVHNRVSRFVANGNVVQPGSETVLLELDNLSTATNHNGGAIHFGRDGKLYIAVGENATESNSQTLSNLLGKILRINRNGTIPSDNPFVGVPGARGEIWALGLRNPFTFSVQPGTGRIFVNDVGGTAFEEINELVKGGNYGWPEAEGPSSNPAFIDPLFSYQRNTGQPQGRVITGGAFYNPPAQVFPASYQGDYFFADLLGQWIWKYDVATDTATEFATNVNGPVDLLTSPDGDLYYLEFGFSAGAGQLKAIRFTNGAPLVEMFGDRTYREDNPPLTLGHKSQVIDSTSANFAGGRLTAVISANAESSDRLGIRNSVVVSTSGANVLVGGVVVGTFSGGNGTTPLAIQFNAQATPRRVQSLLRHLTFHNVSQDPSTAQRTILVRINDGDGNTSRAEVKRVRVVALAGSPTAAALLALEDGSTQDRGPLLVAAAVDTSAAPRAALVDQVIERLILSEERALIE